ncbi:MAG: GAF domain-containing protein [Firmicutes bacterium]|nr:GAF domain-containing protein [Bacillota bacterium]
MGPNLSVDEGPGSDPERLALTSEIERLRAQIASLEAERDEYAQQNAELFVLQQVFSTINSTLEIGDILSMLLRGVCQTLQFNRVILFDVLASGEIVRRLESDPAGNVVGALDPHDYRPGSTLFAVASGASQVAFGSGEDADKPLEDTRSPYCVAPLVARDVVRGMLYIEGPPSGAITENQIRVLLDTACSTSKGRPQARSRRTRFGSCSTLQLRRQ